MIHMFLENLYQMKKNHENGTVSPTSSHWGRATLPTLLSPSHYSLIGGFLINSRIGNPVIGLCFLENLNTQDNSIPKVVTVKKKQKEWHIQKVSDIRVF